MEKSSRSRYKEANKLTTSFIYSRSHAYFLSYADLVHWYKKELAMSTLSLSLYASLYMCLSMYVSLYISLYVSREWERARMETSATPSYNRIEDTCFLWAVYCNFDIKIPDSMLPGLNKKSHKHMHFYPWVKQIKHSTMLKHE